MKPELIREKFFSVQSGTDPIVIALAEKIKRQDSKYNFVPSVVKKAGYPVWHKAKVATSGGQLNRVADGELQVFIPFVVDSIQQTRAVLTVKIDDADTVFRILYSNQYATGGFDTTENGGMWSAQETFAVFTMFDKDIYGHTKFKVYDSRLLGTATDTIGTSPVTAAITDISSTRQGQQISARGMITVWITYVVCEVCLPARNAAPAGRLSDFIFCCNPSYHLVGTLYWIDDDPLPGGGGWWDGGGGGGGCGEPCAPCPGCDWTQDNPCINPDPNMPQVPCDDQWRPVTENVPDPFDVNKFDSVGVSDEIRDSFPCVYEIIKDDLWDINKTIQIGFHDFFSVNQYNHIFFKLDYSMCGAGDTVNGETSPYPTRMMINGNQHFIDTISLNPCFLARASREAIVGTIIHESIHAYIEWCLKDYERYGGTQPGYTIDSFYLKEHFPLHWDYIKKKQYSHAPDHDQMVNDLVNYIASEIYTWGNPNAPTPLRQFVASNIAKIGLHKTSAWGQAGPLLDTCSIIAVDHWSNNFRTAIPGSNIQYGGPDCGYTFPNFRDSLQMLRGDSCH